VPDNWTKNTSAGDFIAVFSIAQPIDEDHGMSAGGRGAVSSGNRGARSSKFCDGTTQTVRNNGAPLGITVAFNIPELQA